MKLPKVQELVNNWPKSLPFLKESTLSYFHKNDIATDNVWFADIEILLPEKLKDKDNIQVVVFGGFLERILESGNWPAKNYTFWCLSPRVKDIIVELLNFPEASVNVIPRYDFVEKNRVEKKLDLNSDIQLIYSGRLSSQKNIEMVLAFASILQERIKPDVNLVLLGDWGDQPPKSRGRFKIESYKKSVEDFQAQLKWRNEPRIENSFGPGEWTQVIDSNSLLINFSTYVHEDFGVSIAEAQETGVPMLLSKWGGHCDVVGKNIQWVETTDIGESLTASENVILKAQVAVEKFLNGKLQIADSFSVVNSNAKIEFLSFEKLGQLRLKSMDQHGYGMSLIAQGWMTLFADTEEGREFFKKYSDIFRGRVQ